MNGLTLTRPAPSVRADTTPDTVTTSTAIEASRPPFESPPNLTAVAAAAVALARARAAACRVDGLIIGTGQEDFTKGNTLYTLRHKGRTFQLMDVPGIEGDESRYVHLVQAAVAKAHLVFYVQGTNKKPEVETVKKIREYLKRGTQVCPLVNVRGWADAYEFEEDRQDLLQQGGAGTALKQTQRTLAAALQPEMLLPGHCVQGLLAFSALALLGDSHASSIHPTRDDDLGKAQRSYLRVFGNPEDMTNFSGIEAVADVLRGKLSTFREDIIEANKVKVRELLTDTLTRLDGTLEQHAVFMSKVQSDFNHCVTSLGEAFDVFESIVRTTRRKLTTKFFTELIDQADEIVATHFGEQETIELHLRSAFKSGQEQLEQEFQAVISDSAKALVAASQRAVERLVQDVGRKSYQWSRSRGSAKQLEVSYQTVQLNMGLGAKGWGGLAANVTSYAVTGATLGSTFPIIGTAIGAAVGALVGLVMGIVGIFTGKEKRIRKAQQQVQGTITSARREALDKVDHADDALIAETRAQIHDALLGHIEQLRTDLDSPRHLIERRVKWLQKLLTRLRDMPHGTIQAIRPQQAGHHAAPAAARRRTSAAR